MNRHAIARMATISLLAAAATGCVDNKTRQRLTMLEQTNLDLTERLNQATADLDAAALHHEDVDRELQAALADAEQCRAELTARSDSPAGAEQPVLEPAAPGWTSVPGGAMIAVEGGILFAPGKMVVLSQAHAALNSIAATIKSTYGDKDIVVFGHTDDQPIKKSGWDDNWQLSAERAMAVVRYLQNRGVSPDRLIAAGCGEHRPLVDNRTAANRAMNRRVEIIAVDPQGLTLN